MSLAIRSTPDPMSSSYLLSVLYTDGMESESSTVKLATLEDVRRLEWCLYKNLKGYLQVHCRTEEE